MVPHVLIYQFHLGTAPLGFPFGVRNLPLIQALEAKARELL